MHSLNCWDVKKCGREPGGSKVNELGVCPSVTAKNLNGINSGKNGGRACWALAGTFCGGIVQGSFATKLSNCLKCDFYKQVFVEEGKNYTKTSSIINDYLK